MPAAGCWCAGHIPTPRGGWRHTAQAGGRRLMILSAAGGGQRCAAPTAGPGTARFAVNADRRVGLLTAGGPKAPRRCYAAPHLAGLSRPGSRAVRSKHRLWGDRLTAPRLTRQSADKPPFTAFAMRMAKPAQHPDLQPASLCQVIQFWLATGRPLQRRQIALGP